MYLAVQYISVYKLVNDLLFISYHFVNHQKTIYTLIGNRYSNLELDVSTNIGMVVFTRKISSFTLDLRHKLNIRTISVKYLSIGVPIICTITLRTY